MSEMSEIEVISHQGKQYQRVHPDDIDFDAMTPVMKIADVIAVPPEWVDTFIQAHRPDINETIEGLWLVLSIEEIAASSLSDKLSQAPYKWMLSETFQILYSSVHADEEGDYSDYNVQDAETFRFSHNPMTIYVARVPFNFVITNVRGEDQYIEEGGYIAYSPNTSKAKRDIWGIATSRGRGADALERTYTRTDDGNDERMMDVYKHVIMADRSPIAGIQFNMKDLARAYERIGKDLGHLEKYQ